jgi:hypothetical protein
MEQSNSDLLVKLNYESNQVKLNLVKLSSFIGSPEYSKISDKQKVLLPLQLNAMLSYQGILAMRIADLKSSVSTDLHNKMKTIRKKFGEDKKEVKGKIEDRNI